MNKTRQRALRAEFKKTRGRAPNPTQWRSDYRSWIPSEWRRLKKAHLAGPPSATADAAITAAVKDARRRARKWAARKRRAGRAAC